MKKTVAWWLVTMEFFANLDSCDAKIGFLISKIWTFIQTQDYESKQEMKMSTNLIFLPSILRIPLWYMQS